MEVGSLGTSSTKKVSGCHLGANLASIRPRLMLDESYAKKDRKNIYWLADLRDSSRAGLSLIKSNRSARS